MLGLPHIFGIPVCHTGFPNDFGRPRPNRRLTKVMRKKLTSLRNQADLKPRWQTERVRTLWRSIKSELTKIQCREISYDEIKSYVGLAKSSAFDIFQRINQPQIEALLCLLDRLPEGSRTRLITEACRCFPSLQDTRLSHDPTQVSMLKTLLSLPSGLALIQG